MRKLSKGEPHEAISDFEGHANWSLSSDYHSIWRELILDVEQCSLSGYTEETIKLDNSHIDHFYKRSLFPKEVHSWDNFIVDSLDDTYGARYKDKLVKNTDDNIKLINPVTEDPHVFFKYKVDGRIAPLDLLSEKDKDRADFTISAFNLNEASLVERRRVLFKNVDDYGDASLEQLLDWLKESGFPSVIEQIYNERMDYDD